jgi:hypothetical protein
MVRHQHISGADKFVFGTVAFKPLKNGRALFVATKPISTLQSNDGHEMNTSAETRAVRAYGAFSLIPAGNRADALNPRSAC